MCACWTSASYNLSAAGMVRVPRIISPASSSNRLGGADNDGQNAVLPDVRDEAIDDLVGNGICDCVSFPEVLKLRVVVDGGHCVYPQLDTGGEQFDEDFAGACDRGGGFLVYQLVNVSVSVEQDWFHCLHLCTDQNARA